MSNKKSIYLQFVAFDENDKLTQLNKNNLYSFLFNTISQTQYIQFFKQIKYLGKKRERERGDNDHNNIKYETCKEMNSYKLCVHNTT